MGLCGQEDPQIEVTDGEEHDDQQAELDLQVGHVTSCDCHMAWTC